MEDFVPFEIAKKLKEKGFNEQCLAYYTKDSDFYYNTSYGSDVENAFKSFNSRPNHICGKRIDAPIISQVLKWLRVKDIMVEILITLSDDGTWSFSFRVQTKKLYDRSMKDYTSYEEAVLACIEHVLDNLI